MREVFSKAGAAGPCVLLIGWHFQSLGLRGDHVAYWQQVVNLLLQELDGNVRNEGVIIVGATNYPEIIDPALLRSGRTDRTITIAPPGIEDMADIFEHHLGGGFDQHNLLAFARALRPTLTARYLPARPRPQPDDSRDYCAPQMSAPRKGAEVKKETHTPPKEDLWGSSQ